MAGLILISAPQASQQRLLGEALKPLADNGFVVEGRFESSNWQELFELSANMGLFEQKRIFIVDDGKGLGPLPQVYLDQLEDFKEALTHIIALFTADHAKIGKQALAKAKVIKPEEVPFWPNQRKDWLISVARREGLLLDSEAAALLVEWVEDPEELRSEISKFKYAMPNGENKISVSLVKSLSMDDGNKAMLNLLDGFGDGNPGLVMHSLSQLRDGGELIPIVAALQKRVRNALYVGIFGPKAEKPLGMTPYQMKTASSMAKKFGVKSLERVLAELVRVSLTERTGEGESWNGLEMTLLGAISRL